MAKPTHPLWGQLTRVKPSQVVALVLALIAVASPYTNILPGWTPPLATAVCLNTLSLLGLNLIFGVVGMLAFGQAAFMALPAYIAGMLDNLGLPFVLDLFIGAAGTICIAWCMARVFVRLPGVYLAVGTLAFGYVIEGLARAFPAITGGASGITFVRGQLLSGSAWYAIAVAALVARHSSLPLAGSERLLAAAANYSRRRTRCRCPRH